MTSAWTCWSGIITENIRKKKKESKKSSWRVQYVFLSHAIGRFKNPGRYLKPLALAECFANLILIQFPSRKVSTIQKVGKRWCLSSS